MHWRTEFSRLERCGWRRWNDASKCPAWTIARRADGQIDGEVYEYGSFLQSRMYRAGVTCSECHEPHSLKLHVLDNGVCLQCHGAEQYDTGKHHFHRASSAGAHCVDCHMPAKTYMVVDPRRDHSFRISRPDLLARLRTPNACTGCHSGRPARWAADKLRQWYGHDPKGYQDYAETLHAARTGAADAEARLVALLGEKTSPPSHGPRRRRNWHRTRHASLMSTPWLSIAPGERAKAGRGGSQPETQPRRSLAQRIAVPMGGGRTAPCAPR